MLLDIKKIIDDLKELLKIDDVKVYTNTVVRGLTTLRVVVRVKGMSFCYEEAALHESLMIPLEHIIQKIAEQLLITIKQYDDKVLIEDYLTQKWGVSNLHNKVREPKPSQYKSLW